MAAFIDYINTPSAQDYSARSKGIDKARASDAFGTLFEGIGKVADNTIKTIDQRNIDTINSELETSVEAIRGAQGVDAAVNDPTVTQGGNGINGASGPAAAPPAVGVGTSEIARLTAAYKDGRVSDTYYFSKVESEARRLRSKFPGYRDEIDQKVSSIIGTNPANALRSSLLRDLKEAQSTATSRANSDESIVERGKQFLSPEKYQKFIQGDRSPAFVADLKMDIQQNELKNQNVSSLKSQYELKKAQGAARQEDIEGIATRDASDTVWGILNSGVDAAGGLSLNTINEKISRMATGAPLSPEEMGSLRTGVAALEQQTMLALDKKFTQGFGQNGQLSYAQELRNPERIKQIKELAMAPIRGMTKALTDGDTGMFAHYANQAKLMKDGAVYDLYLRSDAARDLSAAQTILGPALGQLLLENGVLKKAATDFAAALTRNSVIAGAAGNTNMQDILRNTLREVRTRPNASGLATESTKGVLDAYRFSLSDKKTDDKSLNQLATTLFNPERNFITDKDILTTNSQQSVLQMFSAPELVANMSRLQSSSPQTWANYKNWMESSTRSVFNTTLGQLAEWQKTPQGYNVVIDNQGRISVSRDRSLPTDAFTARVDSAVAGMQKQVGQLNSALAARRAIAQKDGQDPNTVATQFLGALGLQVTPTKGGGPEGTANPNDRSEAGATVQLASNTTDDETFIQLAAPTEAVDLDAQETRRGRTRPTGVANYASVIPPTADLVTAARMAAEELGSTPEDVLTAISYETGGTFDPSIRGGKNNRHIGLIQFGDEEQRTYGANQNQSVGEQMQAVVRYAKHRGFKPGMSFLDLYSTINAGRPGLYNRSDTAAGGAPGTVRDKVEKQMAGHRRKALALLQSE